MSLWTAERSPFDHGSNDQDFVVVGYIEGVPWTLVGCSFRNSSAKGTDYYVRYALEGLAADESAELSQFDEIRIEFTGVWDLVSVRPRTAPESRRESLDLSVEVGETATLELRSELVDLQLDTEGASGFRDRLIFIGRVQTPTSLEHLSALFTAPLSDLITLAVRRAAVTVSTELAGPATTVESRSGRVRRGVATAHWSEVGSKLRTERSSRPALQIPTEPHRFAALFATWFQLHGHLDLPIGLRSADLVADMTYASTRFLLVAQALEALHRRLYPTAINDDGADARDNALAKVSPEHRKALETLLSHAHEPTYRRRLKVLRDEAQPQLSQVVGDHLTRAIDLIVDNRNAVTHWDPAIDEPDGLLLVALRQVADVVFDLVLLKRLGLTDDELVVAVSAYRSTNVCYWLERALADIDGGP